MNKYAIVLLAQSVDIIKKTHQVFYSRSSRFFAQGMHVHVRRKCVQSFFEADNVNRFKMYGKLDDPLYKKTKYWVVFVNRLRDDQ